LRPWNGRFHGPAPGWTRGVIEKEEHTLMKHPWRMARVLVVALAIALVAAACGNDDDGASAGEGGEELSGSIAISGSSTVEPITVAVAEKFRAANPNVEVSVTGPGTSDGFEVFCNGETEISDASRAIDEEEIAKCEQNGIEFIELKVGIDGLSVITSTENDFVECMNYADIWALLGPEAEGFEQWSDANQLGEQFGASAAPYPDEPLVITAPGEESGTFGSFIELTLEEFVEAEGLKEYEEGVTPRPDYQASGNDNVIVEGIAGSPSSLGWVGLAFAGEAEGIASIEVDGGDGCVAPSEEAVADESYPISRPLFIYPSLIAVEENPDVAPFVDYYVSEGLALAGEVGYVALTEEQGQATLEAWEGR
jgi:phosphate transport system substrate-binding protein